MSRIETTTSLVPHSRFAPSPIATADEKDAQRRADLQKLADLDVLVPERQSLWMARRQMLEQTDARGRSDESATPDATATSYLGRLYQRVLMLPMHPATWLMSPKLVGSFNKQAMRAALEQGSCEPVTIPTTDARAAFLDGLLLHSQHANTQTPRPIIVVGVGFAMAYEMAFDKAQEIADAYDVGVLLYDDRGVGLSLGTQYTTQQAVEDCKAALKFAHAQSEHIGYYGISLASAIGLRTVHDLADEGYLQPGDLGLFVSVRGFSSVARVVGGWPEGLCNFIAHPLTRIAYIGPSLATAASLLGAALGVAGRACADTLLTSGGLDKLDMVEALQREVLADEVVITAADNDWLVMGQGQLGCALGFDGSADVTLPSGQEAIYVAHHGQSHSDRNMAHPLHDAALRRWADRAHDTLARLGDALPHTGDASRPMPPKDLLQAQQSAALSMRI